MDTTTATSSPMLLEVKGKQKTFATFQPGITVTRAPHLDEIVGAMRPTSNMKIVELELVGTIHSWMDRKNSPVYKKANETVRLSVEPLSLIAGKPYSGRMSLTARVVAVNYIPQPQIHQTTITFQFDDTRRVGDDITWEEPRH